MADPIDYSITQRILLLIDLHPALITSPSPYLKAVRAAAEAILTIPSLSSSLFSFKCFYSSMPPILYPTKPPLKLRFDQPAATLVLLTEALRSLPRLEDRVDEVVRCSRGLLVESALRQVLHDYGWESEELDSGMDFGIVKSNLVLVLSPVGDSIEFLGNFMDAGKDDELLGCVDKFVGKFRDVFDHVRDAYGRNDIHLAWINVKTELQCRNWDGVDERSEFNNDFFRNGLKSMGWGFCSTDSVVLGSALVPTGLIYPLIGLSSNVRNCDSLSKKYRAQLNLEISDVSGKPLEWKCCNLELNETNLFSRNKHGFGLRGRELICWKENEVTGKSFFDQSCNNTIKLNVQAVMKYSECEKMKGRLTDIVLVREKTRQFGEHGVKVSGEFYADKVLKMLRYEMGDRKETNSDPIWHILLSYLYKESHWGIVSLIDGNGNSYTGILKPFTFDSALLFIVDSVSWPQTETERLDITENVKDDVNSHTFTGDGHIDIKDNSGPLSQDVEKKVRKNSRMLKRLDWTALCKMAYESFRIDIGDAYFTASVDKSKKLKFLQCWMKQIKKRSSNYYITYRPEQHSAPKELKDRLLQSSEDGDQPISSPASVGENSLSGCNRIQDAAVGGLVYETPENFLSNLTKRIQDGLDNEGLDYGAFADRIVNSTIQSLRVTLENEDASQSEAIADPHTDIVTSKIAHELTNLLLTDPKDMKAKHNNSENSAANHSEAIKRRYELQILFRMEIIRSEVAPSIAESMKHKFVKQICMLLERIQCHLEGGFLGDWSLDSYLAKLLKSRYSQDLEDILHQIYSKMDLLLFSEEDENSNFLLNSEDSSQSLRERLGVDSFGETKPILGPASTEHKSHKQLRNKKLNLKGDSSMSHMLKLAKAQEQRERARRFSSFTSWIPDLQRVWAPKQQTQLTHSQSDVSRKHSKRPSRQCASLDMVFETPESNKKSCSRRSIESPCSVAKALFQDTQD
ncbi:hypothetical protein QQ045_022639 [Rhodiola kirilowii]